jgi:hypothetical protein
MVNWNPSFPEVLGNEWLADVGLTTRVWAGAPAAMARYPSTVAETINSLKLSATLNPISAASVPTVIDVIEEGNEDTALFAPVYLPPNSDIQTLGWRTNAGGTTNLFATINETTKQWYGPAAADWIQNGIGNEQAYICSVDATPFKAAGSHVNGRIGFVSISAILGANTGFRKLRLGIQIGGVGYLPAGGNTREVHGYGAMYTLWYGELNPATNKPWTPADIAAFDTAGASRIYVQTVGTSGTQYPIVYALALEVYALPVENRAAVGVWRRPEAVTDRLTNVATDALVTVPSGAAGWSKATPKNYLFYWRQSVSPSLYGPVVGDDVRWNCIRQALPVNGQPPGFSPPPGGVLGAMGTAHDQFGRPTTQAFTPYPAHSVFGLAMVRSDAATSADSQPYRLDAADLASVTSTQTVGQRVTPGSSQTYLGVRLLVIPPASGDPTLTVKIRRVSDSVQIGGTFTITGSAARALPAGSGGWRYVSGFLASGAALVSATAYEIQVSTSTGGTWTVAMPDCSLGNTASFGGSTDGAFIGAAHQVSRELVVTLTRQPDPPTNLTATATDVAVTTFSEVATTVKHIGLAWTVPGVGMGAGFARYEIERQLAGGPWQRIGNVTASGGAAFTDRECPRTVQATYRIRAVGLDGRFSAWATSGNVTITDTRPMLVLSSSHVSLYLVHLYEIVDQTDAETGYPILSTERDEFVAIHGADYQVAFMEAEDRGVGWRTRLSLRQTTMTAKGLARFDALLDLIRSFDVPYVCAMDHQGNHVMGHVQASEGIQTQPDYGYTVQLDITPTHTEPVPAEFG